MNHFLALWPDDDTRQRLAAAAARIVPPGCRAVPAANLHLTLVFVGPVAGDRLAALEACLPASGAPFELVFGATGRFGRAAVGWIAPVRPPQALYTLQADLASRVSDAGFPVDSRPFKPHVTIARPCRKDMPEWDGPEVAWQPDRVALCRSDSTPAGVRYTVVAMR